MDAVTLINDNLDTEKLLIHFDFDKIRTSGDITRSCCKIHGGINPSAFVINNETGLWYCHEMCGGGDAYTLVEKMLNLSFPEAVRWLASFTGVDISNLTITERKSQHIEETKKFIKLMNNKKKSFNNFSISEEIKGVKKYRNFLPSTLEYFGLGYVDKVKLDKRNGETYTLLQRLVFPIIFNNIQIGILFRRVNNQDYPKWSNQPVDLNFGDILYNYDNAVGSAVVVVCEGILDVWAFHEIGVTAVATLGAHITDEQYKLLLMTGADIVLAYDGDKAGREVVSKAKEMFKNKANLSYILFDEGTDPESIDREELNNRYSKRSPIR